MAHLFKDEKHLTDMLSQFTDEDIELFKEMHNTISDEQEETINTVMQLKKIDELLDVVLKQMKRLDRVVDGLKKQLKSREKKLSKCKDRKEASFIERENYEAINISFTVYRDEMMILLPEYNKMMKLLKKFEKKEKKNLSVYLRLSGLHKQISEQMKYYRRITQQFRLYFEHHARHDFDFKIS